MPISRLCVTGYIGPATAPCTARNSSSMPMFCEMPHRNEDATNSSVQAVNRRTSPKRRVRKPVSGSEIAMLTANEVITQVLWSLLTPRLPAMVGSDTFAIVVSSTCMKVASDSPIVVTARFGGRKWVLMGFVVGSAFPSPACGRGCPEGGRGCARSAVSPALSPAPLSQAGKGLGSLLRAARHVGVDDLGDQAVGLGRLLLVDIGAEDRLGGRLLRQHR